MQREVVHLLYLPVLVLDFFVFDLSAFFFFSLVRSRWIWGEGGGRCAINRCMFFYAEFEIELRFIFLNKSELTVAIVKRREGMKM